MLKIYQRFQARQLIAVYVEPGEIEIIRGRRKWRTWQFSPAESYPVGKTESPFDVLQRLNVHSANASSCVLLVIAARTYYNFHREYYPVALKNEIADVLPFDWDENLFYETDRSLYFSGQAIIGQDRLVIPIFSMQKEVYEKFYQALNGSQYARFVVLPSALAFKVHASAANIGNDEGSQFAARCLDSKTIEIHHYQNGTVVDSLLLSRNSTTFRLFLEEFASYWINKEEPAPGIPLYCKGNEKPNILGEIGDSSQLNFVKCLIDDIFVSEWHQTFTNEVALTGFGGTVALRPRQIPKVIYPIITLFAVYAIFAGYQLHMRNGLLAEYHHAQVQRHQLEARWKPIEQRQARMAKLREDQQSLKQFDAKGYPVLQLISFLTDITPMDTWLEFLSLKDKELRLRGQSKAAVKYVSLLSKVEGFEKVSLVSPIRRAPRTDRERFYLRIQVNPEKLKKTLENIQIEEDDESSVNEGAGNPEKISKNNVTNETHNN